ncbi:peptidase S8/S53 domain-containing protein [Mycena maculata]|uniref:Peptidase S8/S53 domain-containing protein n=1 Tax=Mycena maculata TaxID=230809 RepID=A0AAD7HB81_9AGAR|nr:peptidase S8/S53 domain-containing protein [Mycena maculata]
MKSFIFLPIVLPFLQAASALPATTTGESHNITKDANVIVSSIGKSWNLARLAQPDKLRPGQAGQGTSDTTQNWSVNLKDNLGQGVFIYVIDTGVDGNHPLLTPRVQRGADLEGGAGNVEGDGHGTEVAGAAAAKDFGTAMGATIVPIKIYSSPQLGTLADLVNGVWEAVDDFGVKLALDKNAAAVINISIDSPNDSGLRAAIAAALKKKMHVVIAAGNDKKDRCNGDWITTKQNTDVQDAINVGATDIADNIAVFPSVDRPGSNFGACVDIYAGGYNIWTSGPNKSTQLTFGTSLAAPQVAGIIAGIIKAEGNTDPTAMKAKVINLATLGKIQGLAAGSNNRIAQFPASFKQVLLSPITAENSNSDAENVGLFQEGGASQLPMNVLAMAD